MAPIYLIRGYKSPIYFSYIPYIFLKFLFFLVVQYGQAGNWIILHSFAFKMGSTYNIRVEIWKQRQEHHHLSGYWLSNKVSTYVGKPSRPMMFFWRKKYVPFFLRLLPESLTVLENIIWTFHIWLVQFIPLEFISFFLRMKH